MRDNWIVEMKFLLSSHGKRFSCENDVIYIGAKKELGNSAFGFGLDRLGISVFLILFRCKLEVLLH